MKTFFTSLVLSVLALNLFAQDFNIRQISSDVLTHETRGFAQGLNDTVYVFSSTDDIFKIDTTGQVFEVSYECPSWCEVSDIYVDNEGALYVASEWGGVVKVVGNTTEVVLADEDVKSIAVSESGTVYAGVTDGGLYVNDGTGWTVYTSSNSGLASNLIYDIDIDEEGNVWMATYSGLAKLSGTTITNYAHNNLSTTFYSLDIGPDGTAWANSGYGGVGGHSGDSWTYFPSVFSSFQSTNGVGVTSFNTVWVPFGATKEIFRIKDGEAETIPFFQLGIGSSFLVRSVFMDKKDQFWVSLAYNTDLAIITEDVVISVNDLENTSKVASVSPNPASNYFKITIDKKVSNLDNKSVVVFNAIGQEVHRSSFPDYQTESEVDVSQLKKGLYFYQIERHGKVLFTGKLIVE